MDYTASERDVFGFDGSGGAASDVSGVASPARPAERSWITGWAFGGHGRVDSEGRYTINKQLAMLLASQAAEKASPALPTANRVVRCTLDYLGYSFKPHTPITEILPLFAPHDQWVDMDKGGFGYKRSLRCGHITAYYEGNGGTIYVDCRGKGCRQLEDFRVRGGDWRPFLRELLDTGGSFARTDWAFDDFAGLVDLSNVKQAITDRRVVSKFTKARGNNTWELKSGLNDGETVTFGSPFSDMNICIYNKRLERLAKGEDCPEEHWTRVEMRGRNDRAEVLVQTYLLGDVEALAGQLYAYLDFKDANEGDSNQRRWDTCSWWSEFVGNVSKSVLSVLPRAAHSLERSRLWFRKTVASTVAMLVKAEGGCMEWLREVVEEAKLQPWQQALLLGEGVTT